MNTRELTSDMVEKEVAVALKLVELVFRSWYYFRLGYGTYLTFLVGFAGNVVAIYYLAIKNLPFLYVIFHHFYVFVIISILLMVPIGVLIGWLHMKRTLAYPTDMAIGAEANPYNYMLLPGKETELLAPYWLMITNSLQKILEKENILSPEEKREFENIRAMIERLKKGQVIGRPRQRQLLARLERGKRLIQ